MVGKIDAVYIGPPKSASTWLYSCFNEHPEICVAKTDSTHYYNMYYHSKGKKWFNDLFKKGKKNQIIVDMCQDYMVSPLAAARIAKDNPNVKIITCLRNPINRAFSHYWHAKKKEVINYEFSDILTNYDLFRNWLEIGFYAEHLKKYFELFPKKNILILLFDDLEKNPDEFLRRTLEFLGVDKDFKPSIIHQKINVSGYKQNVGIKAIKKTGELMKKLGLHKLFVYIKEVKADEFFQKKMSTKGDYEKGIDPLLRKELLKITVPEIEKLEKLLKVDLSHWKK